jgi:hypothetical protein
MVFVFGPYRISNPRRAEQQRQQRQETETANEDADDKTLMRLARERMDLIREELMRVTWRPDRMRRRPASMVCTPASKSNCVFVSAMLCSATCLAARSSCRVRAVQGMLFGAAMRWIGTVCADVS